MAPESLAALYDRSAAIVYGVLLRIVGNREVAERLLLDVYTAAAELAEGEAEAAASWVVRRARAAALEWKQGAGAGAVPPGCATIVPLAPRGQALPLERLGVLDPVDRELLEWTYFGGLDAQMAAARAGLTEDEARRRLGAALRSIAARTPLARRGARS